MDKYFIISTISYVCLLVIVLHEINASENLEYNHGTTIQRQRRFLSFTNSSHFFVRLNFKANMVPWNQIYAQALGYRMNWDEPPDTFHPFHRLGRRSAYEHLEILFNKNGFNGYQCLRRAICEIEIVNQPKGIYFNILKIIFRRNNRTDHWHWKNTSECRHAITECPLSILDISMFTDI